MHRTPTAHPPDPGAPGTPGTHIFPDWSLKRPVLNRLDKTNRLGEFKAALRNNLLDQTRVLTMAMWVMLIVCLTGLAGCNVFNFIGQAFKPKERARFVLPIEPTLVLVDDPKHVFRHPGITGFIADQIGYQLLDEQVVAQIVDQNKLDTLMVTSGADFAQMGIDQIGLALGAKQIVHVHIESAALSSQPGLFDPRAVVAVKVIDAVNQKRLFPALGSLETQLDEDLSPAGYRVSVQLKAHGTSEVNARIIKAKTRLLARHIAIKAARLFHRYQEDEQSKEFAN